MPNDVGVARRALPEESALDPRDDDVAAAFEARQHRVHVARDPAPVLREIVHVDGYVQRAHSPRFDGKGLLARQP